MKYFEVLHNFLLQQLCLRQDMALASCIVLLAIILINGGSSEKACYYKNTTHIITPYGSYYHTYYKYDACILSKCCGSPQPGTPKVCCDDTGATVGVIIGFILFIVIIVGVVLLCRRHRRKRYVVIGNERETLIHKGFQQPSSPYNTGYQQSTSG